MNEIVSVFSCLDPIPKKSVTWQETLENIQSDKYKKFILKGRTIKDADKYREYKKKLPCVTFAGEFEKRNKEQVKTSTGFIVSDLDHLKNVEQVFGLLQQDKNAWFVFRSPSGDGLKCGFRSQNIKTDEDIKKLYYAVERYFKEVYGITIDPACKDISRLTFVSYDPDLWINPNPSYFDIKQWVPTTETPKLIPLPENRNNGWKEKYGLKVLESCCLEIQNSQPGNQHCIRLQKSRLIGGYIAGGYIDESTAISQLENAVRLSGAKIIPQALKTVKDGIENGKLLPITVEHNDNHIGNYKNNKDIEYYCDVDAADNHGENVSDVSKVSNVEDVSQSKQMSPNVSKGGENVSRISTAPPQNVAAHIKEWITNSSGSFTTEQLDREFCLTTRLEKNNRSVCLNRYIDKKLISRDKRIKGKYNIINSQIELINILDVKEDPFKLNLPFNLHNYISIPKKAVIIMAGSSNAGKTALILNTLNMNLFQQYEKYYLMSEMGQGEYVDRLKQFKQTPLEAWQAIKAAERSYDFNGIIQHHNANGLTCVDFLEEVEGEYFKIASGIRDIYDALGEGVALIAIQKKTGSDYARGGQATAEKARAYFAVDLITVQDHSIICALKIIKLKRYIKRNLQGHELHFKIYGGSQIEPLTDWMRSENVDRERCAAQYNRTNQDVEIETRDYVVTFKTDAGRIVGINGRDHYKILVNYGMEAEPELERISKDSYKKSFVKDKSWYMQITGILTKKLKNG